MKRTQIETNTLVTTNPKRGALIQNEDGTITKPCSKCKQILPTSSFYKDKQHQSGLASYCKNCALSTYHPDTKPYFTGRVINRVDGIIVERTCSKCHELKLSGEFPLSKHILDSICKKCRRATATEKRKIDKLEGKYGWASNRGLATENSEITSPNPKKSVLIHNEDGTISKICTGCKETLPAGSFCKDRGRASELSSLCKSCRLDRYHAGRKHYSKGRIMNYVDGVLVERTCTKCHELKSREDFSINRHKKQSIDSTCKKCVRAEAAEKRRTDKIEDKHPNRDWEYKYKIHVFTHYCGGTPYCRCCGVTYMPHLSIEHKNQDGAAHRKEIGIRGGARFWRWIIENNYPDDLEVLCRNCNMATYWYGKCGCKHSPPVLVY